MTITMTDRAAHRPVTALPACELERRVLDGDTLLIYPNTPAKQAEYREMVVRSFYLSNANATDVAAVVKSIARMPRRGIRLRYWGESSSYP